MDSSERETERANLRGWIAMDVVSGILGSNGVRHRLLGALAFLLIVSPANAQGDADIARLRAERLAATGQCEQALPLLADLQQQRPADARPLGVAGQCELRLKRYGDAVTSLTAAHRLAPDDAEVSLYLGMAQFHLGDLTEAAQTLAQAEAQGISARPELDLYLGLLALTNAENAEAQIRLDRVRKAAPRRFDPLASYYTGVAAAAEGERRSAVESLQRVAQEHPGTPWAEQAELHLRGIRDARPARWWVEATAGIEYDDNVVLRGSGVQLDPSLISSQNDHRAAWSFEAGYELLQTADWTVGVLGTYYGTVHDDLEDFNVQFPGISLWADRRVGEADLARVQYDFGYAWLGGSEPFLSVQALTPNYYRNWGDAGITRFLTVFERRNYFFSNQDVPGGTGTPGSLCTSSLPCGPPGINEESARNRDGWGLQLGFDHTLPILEGFGPRRADPNPAPGERNARFFLRGGYRFHYYSARGSEYSYQGHELSVGMRMSLPWEFAFEANASYEWRDYRNRSTYPDPEDLFAVQLPSGSIRGLEYGLSGKDRRDDLFHIELALERPITDNLTLAARYVYYDDASNVDVFDYNREVIGLYATFRFSP